MKYKVTNLCGNKNPIELALFVFKVTAKRLVDIDFSKPKYGKTRRKVNQRKPVEEEGTSLADQKRFFEELRRICPNAGCLS